MVACLSCKRQCFVGDNYTKNCKNCNMPMCVNCYYGNLCHKCLMAEYVLQKICQ